MTFMVDISYSSSLSARFSANLSNRRKELGLTQAYLAEQMKMEPESISRFERGVTLPSLAVLEKLAGLLNTTIAALLAEYPEEVYPEAQRISAVMQALPSDERKRLAKIMEELCDMLGGRG